MKTASLALAATVALWSLAYHRSHAAEAAAATPSVDAVLAKYVDAVGGRAAIEKQTSRVIKAALEGFGMPAPMDWAMYTKAPNKTLSEVDIPGMGKMLDGFDGQVGWSKNPFAGLRVKEGPELAKQKRDADFYRDLHLKTAYTNLTVKGTEKVADADAVLLEAKPTPDTSERMYFDAKSGLLVRQDSEFDTPEGRTKLQIVFSDYRESDGVKVPYAMRFNMTLPGQPAAEFTIKVKEVKHNETIDDAKFAKPAA